MSKLERLRVALDRQQTLLAVVPRETAVMLLAVAEAARALQVADRRHGLAVEPEVEVAMGALFAALAPLLEVAG